MKTFFSSVLFCIFSFSNLLAQSQQAVGCIDAAIRLQAQDLKNQFKEQNFVLMRDAMLTMENETPFPVAIELKKGAFYQIIFIGSSRSSKINIEIFDGDDKKIGVKEAAVYNGNTNFISFSFSPEKTDAYLFVLSQKMKSKSTCGSFTILELKEH